MHLSYNEANKNYKDHNYEAAEHLYLKCLEARFRESDCLNNLANSYCQAYLLNLHLCLLDWYRPNPEREDYLQSFKLYEKAIELEPNHINANFNIAIHLRIGKFEDKLKALKHLKIAASQSANDSGIRYHLANCKESLNDYSGAINDYRVTPLGRRP